MSKLILTGDTNNNFGKLLPAPYIDQIYINETSEITTEETEVEGAWVYDLDTGESVWVESGTTTITTLAGASTAIIDVDIEIYIRAEENTDITTLAKQLENLRITWFYVSTDSFDWDLDDLKDKKENIWAFYKQAIDEVPNCAAVFLLSDIIYDDTGALTHTIVYDDEGYRALKFKYSSKDAVESLVVYNGSTAPSVWSAVDEEEEEVEGDIYLFTFAAFDDPTTDEDATSFWYAYGGDYDDRFGRFLTIETGDTAYDAVWVDGEPAWGRQIIWVDGDDNLYDDVPLQSLSSKYYSIEKMTHSEIVSSFEELLESYETKAETDDILQDTMDQISYILETNGADINLLSQLNKLSRAFPSKSSATATGLLYIDYNKKISAANAVIETGTQVYRKVMINSKVVDEREGATTSWEELIYTDPDTELDRLETSYEGFVSNMMFGRSQIDTSEGSFATYNNYGFVFFDYEKAVYETAAIGSYFQLETIYKILGQNLLNDYFKLASAILTKEYVSSPFIEMVSTFADDGYTIETLTWQDTGTEAGVLEDHAEPYVADSDGYYAYSFVLLRNMELAKGASGYTGAGWNGYRMMCFEIQDFEDVDALLYGTSTAWEDMQYKFDVIVKDNTGQMVIDLITEYQNLYAVDGGLYEYYTTATDPANYSSEEKWTDSFQALMHDIYDEDEGSAPWILYPTYYCVFLDLATGEFGADSDKIADEVTRISSRINPYNGSLSELESFWEEFQALADDGALGQILVDIDSESVTSVEKSFYNSFGYDTDVDFEQDASMPGGSLLSTVAYAVDTHGVPIVTIEARSYSPSDGEEGVSISKSDTRLKASYTDYGKSPESNGFFLGGVSTTSTYSADGWGQLQASDDVVSYFTVTYESGGFPVSVPIKKVTVRWTAFSLAFVVQFKNNLDYDTEYKWSFTNGTDSDTMITDEHLTPLTDFELTFRTGGGGGGGRPVDEELEGEEI